MSTIYLCPNQWLFKAWHWLIRSSTPSKQFLHATLKKINANRSQISHTNTNGCTDADVLTRKSSSAKISAQLLLFQVSADPEQEHWGVTHVTHATCATLQKSRPSLTELFLIYEWSQNVSSSESESAPPQACCVTSKENFLTGNTQYSVIVWTQTLLQRQMYSVGAALWKSKVQGTSVVHLEVTQGEKKEKAAAPAHSLQSTSLRASARHLPQRSLYLEEQL